MAFKNLIDDLKRISILVLVGLPLIASANIDCNGKSFHCLNSTHFMICVDLGGGRSSTVDDFVIPCPPPTVCHGKNRFECEFPPSTSAPILVTTASDVMNNAVTSDATVAWEEINVTSTMYKTVSKEERLESSLVSFTESLNDSVTTELIPTKQLNDIKTNVNTTETNFTTATTQSPTKEFTTENGESAISNTTEKAVSNKPRVEINTVSLTTSLNDSVTTELILNEQINNTEIVSVSTIKDNNKTTVVMEPVSTGHIDKIDIKVNAPRSNFTAATESLSTASTANNGIQSINKVTEKEDHHEVGLEINTVSSTTSINDNVTTELFPTEQINNTEININATEIKSTTSSIESVITDFPIVSGIPVINNVTEKAVINEAALEINTVNSTITLNYSITTEFIPSEPIDNIGINVKATENNFTITNTESLTTEFTTINDISVINNITEKAVNHEAGLGVNTVTSTTSINDNVTTKLIPTAPTYGIEINVNATENNFLTAIATKSFSTGQSNVISTTESLIMESTTVNGIPAINIDTEKVVRNEGLLDIDTVSFTASINDNITTELLPAEQIHNIEININATVNKFIATTLESLTTNFPIVNDTLAISNVTEQPMNNEAGLEINAVSSTLNDSVTTELIPVVQIANATENSFTTTTAYPSTGFMAENAINYVTEKAITNEKHVEINTITLTTSLDDSVTKKLIQTEQISKINVNATEKNFTATVATELISTGQIDNTDVKANTTGNSFTAVTESLNTASTPVNDILTINYVTEKAVSNEGHFEITTVTLTTPSNYSVPTEFVSTGPIDNVEIKANATEYNFTATTESLNTTSTAVNGIPAINNVTEKAIGNEERFKITTVSLTTPLNYSVATELISSGLTDNNEMKSSATEKKFTTTVAPAAEFVSTRQIEIKANATESNFTATTESLITKSTAVNNIPVINKVTEKSVSNEERFEITIVSLTTPLNYSVATESVLTGQIDNIEIKPNASENKFTTTVIESPTIAFAIANDISNVTEKATNSEAGLEINTDSLTSSVNDSVTTELIPAEQMNNIEINMKATENYFTTTTTESLTTQLTTAKGTSNIINASEIVVATEAPLEITTVTLARPLNDSVAKKSITPVQIDNIEIKANTTENNFTNSTTESLTTEIATENGSLAIKYATEKAVNNEARVEINTESLTTSLADSVTKELIPPEQIKNIEINVNATENNSPTSVATEYVSTGQIANIEIKENAIENYFSAAAESLKTKSTAVSGIPVTYNVTEKANKTSIETENVTNNDIVNKKSVTNILESNMTVNTLLTETTGYSNYKVSIKNVTTPKMLISSNAYGLIIANATNASLEMIKTNTNQRNDLYSISTNADMFTTIKPIQYNPTKPGKSIITAGNVISTTEPYNAIPVTIENTTFQNITDLLEPHVVYTTPTSSKTTTQVSEDVDATFNIFTGLEAASKISDKNVTKSENNSKDAIPDKLFSNTTSSLNVDHKLQNFDISTIWSEMVIKTTDSTKNIDFKSTTQTMGDTDSTTSRSSITNSTSQIEITTITSASEIKTEKMLISKELTTGANSTIDFSGTAYELTTSSSLLETSINVLSHAMTTAAANNNTVIITESYSPNNISVNVITTETLPVKGITLPRHNTVVYTNNNNSNMNSSSIPQIIEEKENGINRNQTTNFFGSHTTITTSDFEEIVNNSNETVSLKSQNLQTAVVPTYYTTLPVAQSDTTKIFATTTNETLIIRNEEILSNTEIPKVELSYQNITTGPESVFKDSDPTTTKNPLQTVTKIISEPDINTVSPMNIDNKVSSKLPEDNQKGTTIFDENLTSNHTEMSQSTVKHKFENIINSTLTDAKQPSKIRTIHEGAETIDQSTPVYSFAITKESINKASSALNSSLQIEAKLFNSTLRSSSVTGIVSQATAINDSDNKMLPNLENQTPSSRFASKSTMITSIPILEKNESNVTHSNLLLNSSLSDKMVSASSTNISQEYNIENNFANSQIVSVLPLAMKNSETNENQSSIASASAIADITHSPEKKSHSVMSTENAQRALETKNFAPFIFQESELLQTGQNGVTTTPSSISSDYIFTPKAILQDSMYTTKIEMSTYTVTKQDAIIGNKQNKDKINQSSLKQYSDLHKTPDQVFIENTVSVGTTPAMHESAKGFTNGVLIYPELTEKHNQESTLKPSTSTLSPLLKPNPYSKITTSVTSGKDKSLDILPQNNYQETLHTSGVITNLQFNSTVKSIENNGSDFSYGIIMPVEKTEILPITTPVLTILEVTDTTTMPSVDQTHELSGQNSGAYGSHSTMDFNTETISESVIPNTHLIKEILESSTIASEFVSTSIIPPSNRMNIDKKLHNPTQNKVVITESYPGQGYTDIVSTENASSAVGINLSNSHLQSTNEDKANEDNVTHNKLSQTNRKPNSTNPHQFINNTDKTTGMRTSQVVNDWTTKNDNLPQVEVIKKISSSLHTQELTVKPSVVPSSITESTPSVSTTVSQLKQLKFDCRHRKRGRYADNEDCRKFYTCIGLDQPIFGLCPVNTVFSDIKKQCTKNLSHCIRGNQFKCVSEGRFDDFKENNVYYICVKNNLNTFVKFKFICQSGYYLDKASVRCVRNRETIVQSVSNDSISKSTPDKKSKEDEKPNKKEDRFKCDEEGKFADPRNCRKFYVCSKSSKSDEFRKRRKKCDSDEVFHKNKKKCVDVESYECS